jgi:hydroxymethylglutaryl-CoA lyase
MANAADVMRGIRREPGVTYIGLVPNERGARDAIESGVDEIATVVSASESHNKANINRTVSETFEEITAVARLAEDAGLRWCGYISTAFGCPYEGEVDEDAVIAMGSRLREAGAYAISLGDTIGVGNPKQVYALVSRFLDEVPSPELRLHFHDTRGMALANVTAAMEAGATAFDGSVGGAGGCPYAPGASGNVATEDMVAMLHAMGIETGVDLDRLTEAAWLAEDVLRRELDGRYKRTRSKE